MHASAQKHLGMLPNQTRSVLSQNHTTVELLERIRLYAGGFDPAARVAATELLARIWHELETAYPLPGFVRAEAERAPNLRREGC
jgi:hypothetical protein